MTSRTVTTQAELDTAIAEKITTIHIESPRGVWLQLHDSGSSSVVARDRSSVVAWDRSSVVAWDRSSVVAWDRSSVEARDRSSVVAWDRSSVEAWDRSSVEARDRSSVVAWDRSSVVARDRSSVEAWDRSSVEARDRSSVEARDRSSVEARDRSSVEAWDRSSVEAWDRSSVEARDRSSVEARDRSSVEARDRSSVEAGTYTAVHLHSQLVRLDAKGAVIDMTAVHLNDLDTWLDYHGVKVNDDGAVTLYKAVDQELVAGHGYKPTKYEIGSTVVAPDWKPTTVCGYGLHFGVSPAHARTYGPRNPRFLAVSVAVADLVALGDKAKARACVVLHEVDLHRRLVAVEVAS